jgi:hypothetical protein
MQASNCLETPSSRGLCYKASKLANLSGSSLGICATSLPIVKTLLFQHTRPSPYQRRDQQGNSPIVKRIGCRRKHVLPHARRASFQKVRPCAALAPCSSCLFISSAQRIPEIQLNAEKVVPTFACTTKSHQINFNSKFTSTVPAFNASLNQELMGSSPACVAHNVQATQ